MKNNKTEIYIVSETQYMNYGHPDISNNMVNFSCPFKTEKEAVKALKQYIGEVVGAEFDGNDELMKTYSKTIKDILATKKQYVKTIKDYNYHWDATDRSVIWKVSRHYL